MQEIYAYFMKIKNIKATDKERILSFSSLNFEYLVREESQIEQYKKDAIYIVDWLKAGKGLIVYF